MSSELTIPSEQTFFVEGTPSEQIPSEIDPPEQIPSEQVQSEQIPSEQVQSEQIPSEQVQSEQIQSEDNPSEQIQSEDNPSEQIPSDDIPSEDNPSELIPSKQAISNNDEKFGQFLNDLLSIIKKFLDELLSMIYKGGKSLCTQETRTQETRTEETITKSQSNIEHWFSRIITGIGLAYCSVSGHSRIYPFFFPKLFLGMMLFDLFHVLFQIYIKN
jgi:hypothetical protein